jgi:uncharacterized protein (TIRG00374 family)
MSTTHARRIRLLLTLAVSVGLLVFVLWEIDGEKAREALAAVRWTMMPLVFAPLVLAFVLRAWRLHLILGEGRPSFRRQLEVAAVGFMAINLVPLRMGEFVRPWMLKDDGLDMGHSLAAIAAERALDLLALLGFVIVVAMSPDVPRGAIVVNGIDVIAASQVAIATVFAVAVAGLAAIGIAGKRAANLLERLPAVGPRLARFSLSFRATLANLVRNPVVAAAAILFSFLVWGGVILSAYALLIAFGTVDVSLTMAAAAAVITVAGSIAIPTPGSIGSFEVFCVAALTVWQVDPDAARTFALMWHLYVLVFNVVPGLVVLSVRGIGVGAVVRESRAQGDPP